MLFGPEGRMVDFVERMKTAVVHPYFRNEEEYRVMYESGWMSTLVDHNLCRDVQYENVKLCQRRVEQERWGVE